MTPDDVIRKRILAAIESMPQKTGLKTLSLALGRNHAYLQQYFSRGSPRSLPEDVRHRLARLLGIDPASISHLPGDETQGDNDTGIENLTAMPIPFLAPHPPAGALPMRADAKAKATPQPWHFPLSMLRQYGIADSGLEALRLATIGDGSADGAMACGDVVLMNTADRDPLAAGYFALDTGRCIRIRHIEKNPGGLRVGHHADHGYLILADAARILGRVLFHFRMMV